MYLYIICNLWYSKVIFLEVSTNSIITLLGEIFLFLLKILRWVFWPRISFKNLSLWFFWLVLTHKMNLCGVEWGNSIEIHGGVFSNVFQNAAVSIARPSHVSELRFWTLFHKNRLKLCEINLDARLHEYSAGFIGVFLHEHHEVTRSINTFLKNPLKWRNTAIAFIRLIRIETG